MFNPFTGEPKTKLGQLLTFAFRLMVGGVSAFVVIGVPVVALLAGLDFLIGPPGPEAPTVEQLQERLLICEMTRGRDC